MEPKRRQLVALAALLAVLAGAVVVQWKGLPQWSGAAGDAPSQNGTSGATSARRADEANALSLHLPDLARSRPEPGAGERNPFRFDRSNPRSSGMASASPENSQPAVPTRPSPPPGPPPIPLKFIGLVDRPGQTARLAVLSDGRNVFHGREGDIIDGRYRIVRIGMESIEITYLDGQGRQVIRLSGSG